MKKLIMVLLLTFTGAHLFAAIPIPPQLKQQIDQLRQMRNRQLAELGQQCPDLKQEYCKQQFERIISAYVTQVKQITSAYVTQVKELLKNIRNVRG